MKTNFSVLRSKGAKLTTAIATSVMAFAANNAVYAIDTDAIEAAQTSGVSAVTLTVAGLIGIVAIVVGVNIVMGLLKKA